MKHDKNEQGLFDWENAAGEKFSVVKFIEMGKWHLSVSPQGEQRDLTYDEIKAIRYEFLPDEVTMGMLFPPTSEFVNVHKHCFHLWQV